MSKTAFDLSTLNLSDGTHTVTVKAKADGFAESNFSNEVSYTKAPSVYTGYFYNDSTLYYLEYQVKNGARKTLNKKSYIKLAIPIGDYFDIIGVGGGSSPKLLSNSGCEISTGELKQIPRITPTEDGWEARYATYKG